MAELIQNLPMKAYLESEAKSRSDFWKIYSEGPRAWRYKREKKSDALNRGIALHTLILEPSKIDDAVIALPRDLNRRTKAGKEVYAQLEAISEGRPLMKVEEIEQCHDVAREVLGFPAARSALAGDGMIEPTIFYEVEGVACKSRPDFLRLEEDRLVYVDIKRTRHPLINRKLEWTVKDYGYHVQASMVEDACAVLYPGVPFQAFWLWIDDNPDIRPIDVKVSSVPEAALQSGREVFHEALNTYKNCVRLNEWPGHGDNPYIEELSWSA